MGLLFNYVAKLMLVISVLNGMSYGKQYSVVIDNEDVDLLHIYCVPSNVLGGTIFAHNIAKSERETWQFPAGEGQDAKYTCSMFWFRRSHITRKATQLNLHMVEVFNFATANIYCVGSSDGGVLTMWWKVDESHISLYDPRSMQYETKYAWATKAIRRS